MLRSTFALAALLAIGACGGSSAQAESTTPPALAPVAAEPAPQPIAPRAQANDGISVEGSLGRVSRASIERAVSAKQDALLQCYATRLAAVPVLSGQVAIRFRIHDGGAVKTAKLDSSTLADETTERCLLDVARTMTFEQPTGGSEAEIVHPFAFDLPEGTRPAVTCSGSCIANLAQAHSLMARVRQCLPARATAINVNVGAYVGTQMRALAYGIEPSADLDDVTRSCVLESLAAHRFGDPGSYPARLRFELSLGASTPATQTPAATNSSRRPRGSRAH